MNDLPKRRINEGFSVTPESPAASLSARINSLLGPDDESTQTSPEVNISDANDLFVETLQLLNAEERSLSDQDATKLNTDLTNLLFEVSQQESDSWLDSSQERAELPDPELLILEGSRIRQKAKTQILRTINPTRPERVVQSGISSLKNFKQALFSGIRTNQAPLEITLYLDSVNSEIEKIAKKQPLTPRAREALLRQVITQTIDRTEQISPLLMAQGSDRSIQFSQEDYLAIVSMQVLNEKISREDSASQLTVAATEGISDGVEIKLRNIETTGLYGTEGFNPNRDTLEVAEAMAVTAKLKQLQERGSAYLKQGKRMPPDLERTIGVLDAFLIAEKIDPEKHGYHLTAQEIQNIWSSNQASTPDLRAETSQTDTEAVLSEDEFNIAQAALANIRRGQSAHESEETRGARNKIAEGRVDIRQRTNTLVEQSYFQKRIYRDIFSKQLQLAKEKAISLRKPVDQEFFESFLAEIAGGRYFVPLSDGELGALILECLFQLPKDGNIINFNNLYSIKRTKVVLDTSKNYAEFDTNSPLSFSEAEDKAGEIFQKIVREIRAESQRRDLVDEEVALLQEFTREAFNDRINYLISQGADQEQILRLKQNMLTFGLRPEDPDDIYSIQELRHAGAGFLNERVVGSGHYLKRYANLKATVDDFLDEHRKEVNNQNSYAYRINQAYLGLRSNDPTIGYPELLYLADEIADQFESAQIQAGEGRLKPDLGNYIREYAFRYGLGFSEMRVLARILTQEVHSNRSILMEISPHNIELRLRALQEQIGDLPQDEQKAKLINENRQIYSDLQKIARAKARAEFARQTAGTTQPTRRRSYRFWAQPEAATSAPDQRVASIREYHYMLQAIELAQRNNMNGDILISSFYESLYDGFQDKLFKEALGTIESSVDVNDANLSYFSSPDKIRALMRSKGIKVQHTGRSERPKNYTRTDYESKVINDTTRTAYASLLDAKITENSIQDRDELLEHRLDFGDLMDVAAEILILHQEAFSMAVDRRTGTSRIKPEAVLEEVLTRRGVEDEDLPILNIIIGNRLNFPSNSDHPFDISFFARLVQTIDGDAYMQIRYSEFLRDYIDRIVSKGVVSKENATALFIREVQFTPLDEDIKGQLIKLLNYEQVQAEYSAAVILRNSTTDSVRTLAETLPADLTNQTWQQIVTELTGKRTFDYMNSLKVAYLRLQEERNLLSRFPGFKTYERVEYQTLISDNASLNALERSLTQAGAVNDANVRALLATKGYNADQANEIALSIARLRNVPRQ